LESLVYLQFGIAALPAMVLDLNQNGMALQAPEPLPPVQQVPMRFVLPGTPHMVEGMGEVVSGSIHCQVPAHPVVIGFPGGMAAGLKPVPNESSRTLLSATLCDSQ